jgi:hypothetical protein
MALSTAVITASLIVLLILENGTRISPAFPYGLFLVFASITSFLVVGFIKDICIVTPPLRKRLSSISSIHKHYLSPFIDPGTDGRSSKTTYLVILVFFIVGVLLTILGLYF